MGFTILHTIYPNRAHSSAYNQNINLASSTHTCPFCPWLFDAQNPHFSLPNLSNALKTLPKMSKHVQMCIFVFSSCPLFTRILFWAIHQWDKRNNARLCMWFQLVMGGSAQYLTHVYKSSERRGGNSKNSSFLRIWPGQRRLRMYVAGEGEFWHSC